MNVNEDSLKTPTAPSDGANEFLRAFPSRLETDILIVGAGMGGVAGALAACRRGYRVVLTEPTQWIGGQLTSQGVPMDEHSWIEDFGCTASYRSVRDAIRAYYKDHYPLSYASRRDRTLNPGQGRVSRLCHEPRVAAAVLESFVSQYVASGRLTILRGVRPTAADVTGTTIRRVAVTCGGGATTWIHAEYIIDSTELGDLLPLVGAEYVQGFESRAETGEPSAPDEARPDEIQAMSWAFAIEHRENEDHTIERPDDYEFWRGYQPEFWPAPLFSLIAPDPRTLEPLRRTFEPNRSTGPVIADQSRDPGDRDLWAFRRILARDTFAPGFLESDVTVVNWPMIDYMEGHLLVDDPEEAARHREGAYRQARAFLYWLQTEAPRADGGRGWPGLRPRGDVMGTEDGFAKDVYIRESRRIRAITTVKEQDVSLAVRGSAGARPFDDSIGVGMYRIDLHPTTGGSNYLDVASTPFQIPLGALIPQRLDNILAGGKCMGTTHITNGCYRLHPVEWNVGEAAGAVASYCLEHSVSPREVQSQSVLLSRFQDELVADGFELSWPSVRGY